MKGNEPHERVANALRQGERRTRPCCGSGDRSSLELQEILRRILTLEHEHNEHGHLCFRSTSGTPSTVGNISPVCPHVGPHHSRGFHKHFWFCLYLVDPQGIRG